jgi:5-methylcytosine-specific restriction enzyme subunit McrC
LDVYVAPKLNKESISLDYIKILLEALQEEDNFEHLNGLIDGKFDEDWLEIEGTQQLLLTPFLIAQFLSVTKLLVRKGLKKSYYRRQRNLRNRVKGKILVGLQVKQNLLKNRWTETTCSYEEFGYDTEVNQFLKYVLKQIKLHMSDWSTEMEMVGQLQNQLNYCKGGFQQVSDTSFTSLKYQENHPFYKHYNVAIGLGNQILRLRNHSLALQKEAVKIKHPRFWIDMSKLFELYVFKKLREQFPKNGEVMYHKKYNRQEPDFILNTQCGIKAVVDAKYKPRYKSGNPSMEDARQLSGYARLNRVYRELGMEKKEIIPCYFIYPSELVLETEQNEVNYDTLEMINCYAILPSSIRQSTTYNEMYLQEITMLVENY